jgi:Leucine-rich repeat (LRR) protein
MVGFGFSTPTPISTRSVLTLLLAALSLLPHSTRATDAGSTSEKAPALSERDILQEFYQATNGPSWNENSGWEDNTFDFCSWYGVICEGEKNDELDNSERHLLQQSREEQRHRRDSITIPVDMHGKVIGLKLRQNNLQGRVPASLWQLPNLRIVTLSDNPIDLAFVGRSDTLIELKMHATNTNTLTGISRFPNIMSLHISGTPLGHIEFPQEVMELKHLNYLHMAECQMEGTLPQRLFDLTALKELNFFNNEFSGLIPAGISLLSDLHLLNLSTNHFRGILPEWLGTTLTNLNELYLENNMLTGQLLSFNKAPNLIRLYLNGNELTQNIPANFLQGLTGTEPVVVNLDNNQLSGLVPDSLDTLETIPLKITLAGNQYTGFNSLALCDNSIWMDGEVSDFGCDAIICPVGTTAALGRHTKNSPCVKCSSGTLMGQMKCMDQDDKRTLQFLYAETGGDHWKRNDHWMDDTKSVCEWYGVKCYTDKDPGGHIGRVKRVILNNNGLIGSISSHIFALDVATEFDFSWNKIQFPFEDIALTKSLHVLNVGHTDTSSFDGLETANPFFEIFLADHLNLEGTIPSQLYENTNLEILSLNNCGFIGTISTQIGSLTKLKELYLWGNDLIGTIPTEIGVLSNLRFLTLAKNKLMGTLPETLENLAGLQAFSIKDQLSKGGGITGNLLPFQRNPILSNLILSGNKFDGSIPEAMLGSIDVEQIEGALIVDLSDNQLTGSVPGSLQKFDEMNLYVQENLISSVNPLLCEKRDWMSGNVGDFGCAAILCPEFTANPLGRQAYDHLDCNVCPDPDSTKTSVGQTSCDGKTAIMSERKILELLYNQCGGNAWVNDENWMSTTNFCSWYGISCDDARSVVSIVLGANNMKGTIPTELFLLPNLKRLSIFSNPIDFDFTGIEAAPNLMALILDETKVLSVSGVGKARGLTELNIRANGLKGTLPDEIADLNSLESLVVSDNQFTGTLPYWLGNLNKLTSLMLSSNQFSGTILPFEKYPDISLLGLARNKLSGTIPENFLAASSKDSKIFCDLASNFLTGTIPGSMFHMNRLSLHVQDNRFEAVAGEICRMKAWNDYDLDTYGCAGLMCPKGTFNPKGRQSSPDSPCEDCPQNQYMGSTQCSSSFQKLLLWSNLLWILGGIMFVV